MENQRIHYYWCFLIQFVHGSYFFIGLEKKIQNSAQWLYSQILMFPAIFILNSINNVRLRIHVFIKVAKEQKWIKFVHVHQDWWHLSEHRHRKSLHIDSLKQKKKHVGSQSVICFHHIDNFLKKIKTRRVTKCNMLSHSTLTMTHRQTKTHWHMNTARKYRAKRWEVIVPTTWRSYGLRLTIVAKGEGNHNGLVMGW